MLGIYGAKVYLADWFMKNGADSATIEKLSLNPFSGRLALKGLDVQAGGKSLLKNADMVVDVGFSSLFNKDIEVEQAFYSGLVLDIEQLSDGSMRLGSYTVAKSEEKTVVEPTKDTVSAWAFLANSVDLQNCKILFKTPDLDLELVVEKAELRKFTTREGKAGATFSFVGSLNGDPVVITLSNLQVIPALHIEGEVKVGRFQLKELARLLKDSLPVFAGDVGLDGKVVFVMGDQAAMNIDYTGEIEATNPDIGSESFATKAASLKWQGAVHYESADKQPMVIVTDGLLAANDYGITVSEAEFSSDEAKIEINGKTRVTIGENVLVENDGSLLVESAAVRLPGTAISEERLEWKGVVQYDSNQQGAGQYVSTKGDLQLGPAAFTSGDAGNKTSVQSNSVSWTGENTVTIGENVLVKNDGALIVESVAVNLPGTVINEERLEWKGAAQYDSNHQATGQYVATKGDLQLGPVAFTSGESGGETSVQSNAVSWKGDITYGQEESGIGSYVLLDGALDGKEIETELSGPEMQLKQGSITLTAASKLNFGDAFDIKGKNSLVLNDFMFSGGDGGLQVLLDKLEILDLEGSGGKKLRLNELTSAGLSLTVPGSFPMDIGVPAIQLNGFATDDLANFKVESISLDKPQIIATHNGEELLSLDEIKATALQLSKSNHVTADSISLAALTFLGVKDTDNKKPFLTLGEANLTGISWAGEQGLSGEVLTFDNLVTTIIRDKQGELNVTERLAAMQVRDEQAEVVLPEPKQEESKGPPIRLGEVAVTGKSHVKFEDYTLAVPYITDLTIKKMQLLALDSTTPEAKSPFVLDAELEERAPFNVEGTLSPFRDPLALDLKLQLKNYPLSRLSAYTVQSVGTALASGQLRLTTKLKLENDKLNMKNDVVLKKLETKTIAPELAAELNNQLPIPLDAALSILRDSDRNISLDIPLSGPVSDLNVGISDVLITALSKAIVPAASGYLMYTLGPYGALAYVGMKVGEKMLKVELPPVDFAPASIEISDEHKKYLEKVAEILKGRPETDIQVCPQVVSWEFMDEKQISAVEGKSVAVVAEDRDKLIELGQQRAQAVQSYLASTHGVKDSRLLICDTLLKEDKGAKPLVMLNL
jgi:outer membrane protein OmpA-like peptidoglycan-associated protein